MIALKITIMIIVISLLCWGGYNIDNLVLQQRQDQLLIKELSSKLDRILMANTPTNSAQQLATDELIEEKLVEDVSPKVIPNSHQKKTNDGLKSISRIAEKNSSEPLKMYTYVQFMGKVRTIERISDIDRLEEMKLNKGQIKLLTIIKENLAEFKQIEHKHELTCKEFEKEIRNL